MVICKFFQTGNCRFGTKCANEHFDVKQLIKTEIEAAIQGRQWPLSSFGPFKEKPCFPNLIEDQSFEEIRYHCYEAKKQNYFQNFEQQFNQQIMEAQNKMKSLLTLNREIVDIVTNIYDNNTESGQQKQSNFVNNSNPFATIGSNNNVQQSASIFGNQQQQVNPFAKANTQNGFGNSGTGIFGGSAQASGTGILGQSSFGNSIFGGSTNPQQLPSSIFSSPAGHQQTTFGGFGKQSQPANIFSQPQQQQQPTSSIFGGQIQSQPQQPFGSNIFGQQSQTQTDIFGQTAAAAVPVQPTTGNIFAQANQKLQQPTGFGQSQIDQQIPAQQNQSLYLFPSQQQPSLQQQPQMNIFAQQQSNQVLPAQSQQSAPNQQQQQIQQNFNQGTTLQNQNIFTQPHQTINHNQQQLQQSEALEISGQMRIGIYSKMEDLSPEDIEAFNADKFMPGKIPCNPPPRELC